MKASLMVDLETLGKRPSTAVISVGAVVFNNTGILRQAEWHLDVPEQLRKQRTVDYSTIQWWMKQSDEARRAAFEPVAVHSLAGFQREFGALIANDDVEVWSCGADFDIAILTHMYDHHKADFPGETPWKFFNTRCYRTIKATTGCDKLVPFDGVKHTALADARHQALCLIAHWSRK